MTVAMSKDLTGVAVRQALNLAQIRELAKMSTNASRNAECVQKGFATILSDLMRVIHQHVLLDSIFIISQNEMTLSNNQKFETFFKFNSFLFALTVNVFEIHA